jgi:SAM-dependent methyltransferase
VSGIGLAVSNSFNDIDWAGMWHRQMDEASFRGQGAEFWDNWARALPAKAEHSGYAEEVMHRLRLAPEYSVLDVGAGTGALAIPLAKKVRSVTALDHSRVMLETVAANARSEGLSNITTLQLDWTRAQLDRDFQRHDVVVVSRSLPAGENIKNSLQLIDAAARRSCYITWKADGWDELESELCAMLGINYVPFPGHVVLYNLLYSLHINAGVELFKTRGCRYYQTLEEAYIQIVRSHPVDEAQKGMVLEFLAGRLKHKDGSYYQPKDALWAMMWWEKAQ